MQPENTEQTNISGTDMPADTLPVRSKGSVRPLFRYWTAFFLAITYWEIFMGRLSQDSFASINFWFLLFAVPQALVFAALCGWGRDRSTASLPPFCCWRCSLFTPLSLSFSALLTR